MTSFVYNVFHKEKVDFKRDLNVDKIKNIMNKNCTDLKSPTIYLSTLEELNSTFNEYPQIKFNKSSDTKRVFPGTTGAAGLWIGTYLAFKNFLSTKADCLFIFEDDVEISENIFKITNLYKQELPDDWDIFSLLVPEDTIPQYTKEHDIEGKQYICSMYQDWSTGGYMVSRKGAEIAIKDIEENGISVPIDFYLYNYRYNNEKPEHYFRSFNIRPRLYTPVKLTPESKISYIGAMEVYKA